MSILKNSYQKINILSLCSTKLKDVVLIDLKMGKTIAKLFIKAVENFKFHNSFKDEW